MISLIGIFQIILSLVLIVLIIIQTKGTGFGRPSASSATFTRRGLEKVVFKLTFVVAFLFIVLSFLPLILN